MPIRVIPNRNWQSRAPQTRQAANFFTKLSGSLSWTHIGGFEQKKWVCGPPVTCCATVRAKLGVRPVSKPQLPPLQRDTSSQFFCKKIYEHIIDTFKVGYKP